MNKVNQIVFSRDTHGDNLWSVVAQQLEILMKNDEICTVYDDDTDIIVISFEHNERKEFWGCTNPYWLTPEEVEWIERLRSEKELENKE